MEVTLSSSDGLVLVDTSYYMFNRYFATLKWYRISKKEPVNIETLHENEEFIKAFKQHTLSDITRYAMYPYQERRYTNRLPQKGKRIRNKVIMCLDCPRNSIWRMRKYPQYKGTRKQVTDININIVAIFYEYLDELIADTEFDIMKMLVDSLEADDVVYLMLKKARAIGYTNKVLVITNDTDFLQMISMNAIIVNAQGVYLDERSAYDPYTSIMLKILTGDTSDNIKHVPCLGGNTSLALQIASLPEKNRQMWIKETGGAACIKVYNLNKKLILLSKIPAPLAQNFANAYVLKSI